MTSTFKTVAYICGLRVFLITDPGYRQSHSDNHSLEPSYLHTLCQSWLPRKRGEEKTELSLSRVIMQLNICHYERMGEEWREPSSAVFLLCGRKHHRWVWMGTGNPHNSWNSGGNKSHKHYVTSKWQVYKQMREDNRMRKAFLGYPIQISILTHLPNASFPLNTTYRLTQILIYDLPKLHTHTKKSLSTRSKMTPQYL